MPRSVLGLNSVAFSDIIEEIIEEEIVDETDRYESNQSKRRAKRMSTATVMKGIVERAKSSLVRGNVDGSMHDGRRSHMTPILISGGEPPSSVSLLHAASESSALLRRQAAERLNGVPEQEYDSQNSNSNASRGAGNRNGATYGAVESSSPPKY